jgi:ComF family protein
VYQGTAQLASMILELLYPGRCLLCGSSLLTPAPYPAAAMAFSPVCRPCLDSLRPLQGRRCLRCSTPLISEQSVCTRCRVRNYLFTANFSVFAYRDSVKELLYQYKFLKRRRAALIIADYLATACGEKFPGLPLVPVPGRRSRDHVDTVCRIMAKTHALPVLRLLSRRGKVPQKSLDYAQRCRNIRGSITCRSDKPVPAGAVVLLDDVFTSGATANECARVLRGRGAASVHVLTFALD